MSTVLRLAHPHSRDARVSFGEPKHQYTVDGHAIVGSMSSLWGSRFEVFSAEATARQCYPKWARSARLGASAWDAGDWTYVDRYVRLVEGGDDDAVRRAGVLGTVPAVGRGYSRLLARLWGTGLGSEECIQAVVGLWRALGEVASAQGTYVHLQCELDCNGETFDSDPVEVRQYRCFREANPELEPFRTEWSIFARLGLYVVVGQVDAVFRDGRGDFHMVDFKCCSHALTPANPYGKTGVAPFDQVPDTPWGHYACQQNIYRYILERYYRVPLRSVKLLRLHPSINGHELVPVPDLRANVAVLFGDLVRATVSPNFFEHKRDLFRRKCRILLCAIRLSFYIASKRKMANQAMKLVDTATALNIKIKFADAQKRAESGSKGLVHHLQSTGADGSLESVYIQLPRGTTFGVRANKSNSSKYQLTMKYREDQLAVVDQLRTVHDRIGQAILESFHILLPKTTKIMLTRLIKKNKKIPANLFEQDWKSDAHAASYEEFLEAARERMEEIFIFGASEENFDAHYGKPKMVSFSSGQTGRDGKSYDKAYMLNIGCPITMKKGGVMQIHPSEDGEIRPMFSFSACEGPENNLKSKVEVTSVQVLDKLAPVDGMPYARDAVAIIGLPFVHIGNDESRISVNVCLEHIHVLLRDEGGGKRKFEVTQDDDTPQIETETISDADVEADDEEYE